ncbi:hypothetical protein [uncultured Ruegeria sp.]|uniref:hypothetical protein n=1 Tax=uncultured Ruegeria sp. TaxID=259304 RepID=UPI00262CADBE|nr:hypothetical protein [uncultured Ruegeria sp.]
MARIGLYTELELEKAAEVFREEFLELRPSEDLVYLFFIRRKKILTNRHEHFRIEVQNLGHFHRRFWESEYGTMSITTNVICVTVDLQNNEARFGPIGNIAMLPQGMGLGTVLMGQAIKWLLVNHPKTSIREGRLSGSDTPSEEKRKRRHSFYEGFGFSVVYTNKEEPEGRFFAECVERLTPKQGKGSFVDVESFASEAGKTKSQNADLIEQVSKLRERRRQLGSGPIDFRGVA